VPRLLSGPGVRSGGYDLSGFRFGADPIVCTLISGSPAFHYEGPIFTGLRILRDQYDLLQQKAYRPERWLAELVAVNLMLIAVINLCYNKVSSGSPRDFLRFLARYRSCVSINS
jgi:hypothetical protein